MPKMSQVFIAQSSFDKRPRVNSRSGVALEINDIAFLVIGAAPEEMIEPDLI